MATDPNSLFFGLTVPVAARLRRTRIGVEELVVALLESRPDSVAREILEELGVDVDAVLEGSAGSPVTGVSVDPMPLEMTMKPVLFEVQGRAHGIAIGSGSAEIDSRHILLAMLPLRADFLGLDYAGITRQKVVEALKRRGLDVAPFWTPDGETYRRGKDGVLRASSGLRDAQA